MAEGNKPTITVGRFGLSNKLLLLTILFVLLAEILIYTPSIARFRQVWLVDKLEEAYLASSAVMAAPENMVTPELETQLLRHVQALSLDVEGEQGSFYILGARNLQRVIDYQVDLEGGTPWSLIKDAYELLFLGSDRIMHIQGVLSDSRAQAIQVVLSEYPLRQEMLAYSWRILLLSLIISLLTAFLVFLSLRGLLVSPWRHLLESLRSFQKQPYAQETLVQPANRRDEIGILFHAVYDMQIALQQALRRKERLADVGTAVAKITHDLRNILAAASLLSERLAKSQDPLVTKIAPKLIDSLDQAVLLCEETIRYADRTELHVKARPCILHKLVVRAGEDVLALCHREEGWHNHVPETLEIGVDADHLQRVFVNLGRNAFEAGASEVRISAHLMPASAEGEADRVCIEISDNGSGLLPRARENLFIPFAGRGAKGGAGLGLSNAREIIQAHGGDLYLRHSDKQGSVFAILLPFGQEKK